MGDLPSIRHTKLWRAMLQELKPARVLLSAERTGAQGGAVAEDSQRNENQSDSLDRGKTQVMLSAKERVEEDVA